MKRQNPDTISDRLSGARAFVAHNFPSATVSLADLLTPSGAEGTVVFEEPKELSFAEDTWRTRARGLARVERATRLVQMILALIHAYHLPLVMDDWITYDFSFFRVGFVVRPPLRGYGGPDCQLIMFDCDGIRVLEVSWDFYTDMTVERFAPFWWEDAMTDIAFWEGKASWSCETVGQTDAGALLVAGDPASDEPILAEYRQSMADMRDEAHVYATQRARYNYGVGDHTRGAMWDDLAAAILSNDTPQNSRMLN